MREVGIRSLAMPPRLRACGAGGAPVWRGAAGFGVGGRAAGSAVAAAPGSAVADGVADALGVGVGVSPASASPSAWGSASAWSSCVPPKNVVLLADDVESPNVSSPAVTTTAAIANAISAGDERDHHLAAGEEPAAAAALVLVEPERIVRVLRIDLDPLLLGVRRARSRGPPGWRTAVPWGVRRQTPTSWTLVTGA